MASEEQSEVLRYGAQPYLSGNTTGTKHLWVFLGFLHCIVRIK